MLSFIPLGVMIYFLHSRIDTPALLIKLTFTFGGLIILYLVFKIIMKLIHRDEEEQEVDTMHIVDITLFNGVTSKQILFGLGGIVGILLFSLIPSPWNIFLILAAFYGMFSMLSKLA